MKYNRLKINSLVSALTMSATFAILAANAQNPNELAAGQPNRSGSRQSWPSTANYINTARRNQSQTAGKNRPIFLSSLSSPGVIAPSATSRSASESYSSNNTKVNSPNNSNSGSRHYELGAQYKQRGDLNHALIEFLQAIKENPRCTKAFYEQALIFREKNYPKLAESALMQALAVDPNFREARILLAAVRLELGNAGGAAAELSKSLGLNEVKSINAQAANKLNQKQTGAVVKSSNFTDIARSTDSEKFTDIGKNSGTPTPSGHQNQQQFKTAHQGNGLLFTPESSDSIKSSPADIALTVKEGGQKNVLGSRPIEKQKLDSDAWAVRLKYLNEHGTGSLKSGEAFMFAEDTGEAVLLLSDGKKIVRQIAAPLNHNELVKSRRPDMLLPADLMYKLSTLGRLVTDPAAIVEMATSPANKDSAREPAGPGNTDDNHSAASENTSDSSTHGGHSSSAKHGATGGSLGELMDANEEKETNFLSKPYLDETPASGTTSTFPAGVSTKFRESAANGIGSANNQSKEDGTGLSSDVEAKSKAEPEDKQATRTEPEGLKNFQRDSEQQPAAALGEAIVERTQKFVGWIKKALRLQ